MEWLRTNQKLAIVVVMSVLATLPVWLAPYPPMTDLPQHAAQISLLRNLHRPGFPFSTLFDTNWFTPYLLGYMMAYILAPVVGIVAALKVVIALAVAAFPIASAFLLRELEGDEFWALLTIPGLYGFAYQWGFLNFILAAPVGIVFLCLAFRHARRPTLRSAVGLTVFAGFLFFCHAAVCAFFLAISACVIAAEARSLRNAFNTVMPFFAILPFMAYWTHRTSQRPMVAHATVWDLSWFSTADPYYTTLARWVEDQHSWGRINGFIPRLLGVQTSLSHVMFGILLFALPVLAGTRLERRWTRWIPFLVCAATLLFAPYIVLNTAFTYQRFTLFALPLFLVGLGGHAVERKHYWMFCRCTVIVIAVLWIGMVSANARKIGAEERGFREIVTRMEPDQRVLSMIVDRDSDESIAPVFAHFPAWYSAERGGVVDPNMALFQPELVVYRRGMVPAARVWDFEWNPTKFKWRRFNGDQYRYFVIRSPGEPRYLFADAECPVRLTFSQNDWWLYEKAADCPGARAAK